MKETFLAIYFVKSRSRLSVREAFLEEGEQELEN
jgi:hypothetical protein